MEFKVFNIEFDGIDKSGKDTIMKQLFSVDPNKYIPKSRGLISQIAYSKLNNRNYSYNINKGYLDNTLFVYLTVDEDDWKIRCDLTNELAIDKARCDTKNNVRLDYSLHMNAFNDAYNEVYNMLENKNHIMSFNTSEITPYKIIMQVISTLNKLNKSGDC